MSPDKKSIKTRQVLDKLRESGLLLEADPRLPSVVTLVIGHPIKGSWWGHPQGNLIFRLTRDLEDRHDVLRIKLISGKITYIHRKLWSRLIPVVACQAPWQVENLSPVGIRLLSKVERSGIIRIDRLAKMGSQEARANKVAANELENRLLVVTSEIHTETGTHAKQLESWKHWATKKHLSVTQKDASLAITESEEAIKQALGIAQVPELPWRP